MRRQWWDSDSNELMREFEMRESLRMYAERENQHVLVLRVPAW